MLVLQIVSNQMLKKLSDGKASSRELMRLQSAIAIRPDQDLLVAELLESCPRVALIILRNYPAHHLYQIINAWLENIDNQRSKGSPVADGYVFETMDQEPAIFLAYTHHQFSYKIRKNCQLNEGSWGIKYLIHHLQESLVLDVQYPRVFERICYAFMSDFIENGFIADLNSLIRLVSLTPNSVIKRVFQKVPDALSIFIEESTSTPQTIQLAAQVLLTVSSTKEKLLEYKRRAISWLIDNKYPQHVVCLFLSIIALKSPDIFNKKDTQRIVESFLGTKAEVPVYCCLLIALGNRVIKELHTKVLSHLVMRVHRVNDQFTILVTTTLMILLKEYNISSKPLRPLCELWATSFLADSENLFPRVLEGDSQLLMLVVGKLGILNLLVNFELAEKPNLSSEKTMIEAFTKYWRKGNQLVCFHLIYCLKESFPIESGKLWRNFLNLSPIQARGTALFCMDQDYDLSLLTLSELIMASKSKPLLELYIEQRGRLTAA